MALLASRAGPLRWEVELSGALADFESSLSVEQRAAFKAVREHAAGSPPTIRDVMNLTAEVDFKARQQKQGSQRCFGPRFTRILESVQQYASIGDVIIGGSQNLIACGVWSLVRISLLTICKFSTYFERLSLLFMKVGQSSPLLQEMAHLFPHSKPLQGLVAQYFIVVIRVCQNTLSLCQQSLLGQIKMFIQDGNVAQYESELTRYSDEIKGQLQVEQIKSTSAMHNAVRSWSIFNKNRVDMENHRKLLDICSTYDYMPAWKRIRKLGNTTWLFGQSEYDEWINSYTSTSLVVRGKLGSGKSVLLANMVDYVNLSQPDSRTAYFFCCEDDVRSLDHRTVFGCLARQLLQLLPPEKSSKHIDLFTPGMTCDQIIIALKLTLEPKEKMVFVLDGIEACTRLERVELLKTLRTLQDAFNIAVCVSCSIGASNEVERDTELLQQRRLVSIPDDRPEIKTFIETRLFYKLEIGDLSIGDPTLILEIQQVLNQGAQGMFLWAHLQIEAICLEKTDQSIREALQSLPKSLPEIFQRIVTRSRHFAAKYQVRALQLLGVAKRPLSQNEFTEAISIVPGDTNITQAHAINDIQSVLASCGSLVILDEEQFTLHFVHHSVKSFILGQLQENNRVDKIDNPFSEYSAQMEMGQAVVTYLSWEGFRSQVSTTVVPQIEIGGLPNHIIGSLPNRSRKIQLMAMELLQRRLKPVEIDVGTSLAAYSGRFNNRSIDQFHFLKYAKDYWLHHTKMVHEASPKVFALFTRLVQNQDLLEAAILWAEKTPFPSPEIGMCSRAHHHSHIGMLEAYLREAIDKMVDAESKHLQFLEDLRDLKLEDHPATMNNHGLISPETIVEHELTMHTGLQLQRRFLADLTAMRLLPSHLQIWGALFIDYENGFNVYLDSLVREIRYQVAESQRIRESFISAINCINATLSISSQRLTDYRIQLMDLSNISRNPKTDPDLSHAISAVERMLSRIEDVFDSIVLEKALDDLVTRVDDWKNQKIENFGKLLLHGTHTVVSKTELQYKVYLFESVFIFCKEMHKSPNLALKGRIFMNNVTENTLLSKPGSHSVQIWWKGDPGIESTIIKFEDEETARQWSVAIEKRRKAYQTVAVRPAEPMTTFAWSTAMSTRLENPYLQDDSDSDYGFEGDEPPTNPGTQGIPLSYGAMRLRAKIRFDDQIDPVYMMLDVANDITYPSLVNNIRAKLWDSTLGSVDSKRLKLRYLDEEGDLVNIEDGDDIRTAFVEYQRIKGSKEHLKDAEGLEIFVSTQK